MRQILGFLSLVAVILLGQPAVYAAPQTDFNSDSLSDTTYVTIGSDAEGTLSWFAVPWGAGGTSSLGTFGKVGDHLILAPWTNTASPQLGVIRADSAGNVSWSVLDGNDQTQSQALGSSTNYFLSGGDYNGNGFTDMAVVEEGGGKLTWRVSTDPFASGGSPASVSFEFGRKNAKKAFFMNPQGSADHAAIIIRKKLKGKRRTVVALRSLSGSETIFTRLGTFARSAGRPVPLRQLSGADLLVFSKAQGITTRVMVMGEKGRKVADITLPITGTLVTGDFTASSGEEIAINTGSGSVLYYNPNDGEQSTASVPSGIPVDEVNINTFGSSDDPTSGVCSAGDPTDGGGGFVWKPNSDTQFFAVVVMGPEFTGKLSKVELYTTQGTLIESLRSKGVGNGNRTSWISGTFTGSSLKSQFGSIVVQATQDSGACVTYAIDNPAQRYD